MFPFSLRHRVAYLNVCSEIAFHSSVAHWRLDPEDERGSWREIPQQQEPVTLRGSDGIEIGSDCIFPVNAEDGGTIHIKGDLKSHLVLGGHHEVVISGDVDQGATIVASGFHRLFVGGSMKGQLRSTDGAKIWVEKDFVGSLETGSPSTSLNIGGDYSGGIAPYVDAALLWMLVGGFATQESIRAISILDYTVFDAVIGRSDVEPGFYPAAGAKRKTKSGYCTSNWSIGSTQR